jgi:hypothetical protein
MKVSNFDSKSECTCNPSDLQPFGECSCGRSRHSKIEKQRVELPPLMAPYTKSVTKNRNSRLEITLKEKQEALKIVGYKIDNLQQFYSIQQIRVWKSQRKALNASIKVIKKHIAIILKSRYND